MRPYAQLTTRGQARRLGAVARTAIGLWPIDIARLRFLADATNVTFRVDATDGTRYALRVARPGEMDPTNAAAEFAWLLDLAEHHPDLGAPRPLATRDGRLLADVTAPGVPQPCWCALLTWIPGVTPGKTSQPADHRRLGTLSARLHAAAETFQPPPGFTPTRWDRVAYFPQDPAVMFEPQYADAVPTDRAPALRAAWDRCQSVLDGVMALPGHRILHGDLHPWNVHRVRTRLRPLDFADLIWGPPVQDIAISLFYLQHRDDYPALRDAFAEGYVTVRPYPAGDAAVVRGLDMAREMMFCNYIVRALPALRKTLPKRFDRLEGWVAGE